MLMDSCQAQPDNAIEWVITRIENPPRTSFQTSAGGQSLTGGHARPDESLQAASAHPADTLRADAPSPSPGAVPRLSLWGLSGSRATPSAAAGDEAAAAAASGGGGGAAAAEGEDAAAWGASLSARSGFMTAREPSPAASPDEARGGGGGGGVGGGGRGGPEPEFRPPQLVWSR
jgi:hypothetical protein